MCCLLARIRACLSSASLQRIALPGDDGAQDPLAGFPDHIGNDVGQLQIHLRQRLLHVLYVLPLVAQQHAPLTHD